MTQDVLDRDCGVGVRTWSKVGETTPEVPGPSQTSRGNVDDREGTSRCGEWVVKTYRDTVRGWG